MNVRFRNDTGLIEDVLEVFRDFPVPGHSSLALERLCDAFERALERRGVTPAATPTDAPALPTDPYCELSVSEIPNFGTNRDTHRCAKLHRERPALPMKETK